MIDYFPKVWVLTDERPGNTTQVIGAAEAFKLPYIEKKIKYSFFSGLPNFMKSKKSHYIHCKESDDIFSGQPNILISAGRRLAHVALYLKHQNPSIFAVNCMNPYTNLKKFDLNILSEHDNCEEKGNIIRVCGSLNKVSKYFLLNQGIKWQNKFSSLKPKKISVFLGGGTKYSNYQVTHFKKLLSLANELAIKENASLLITSSRRTDCNIKNLIDTYIGCSYYFYEYSSIDLDDNPSEGFLAMADAHIVTGDSIGMCSEVVSTGKPSFIFIADEVLKFKHKFFINKLLKEGYALPFDNKSLGIKLCDIKNNYLRESERLSSSLINEYQKFCSKIAAYRK
jgi:mitochondrial fission protein ELM1